MSWPTKDIPTDYLKLAQLLVGKKEITKQEFIRLCKLAIYYTESRELKAQTQGDIFLYIANLWFRHSNIDDNSITSDIGGQFADWEIPGTLDLTHPADKKEWERLKHWIGEADEKYRSTEEKS
jgi:hypothetical protein